MSKTYFDMGKNLKKYEQPELLSWTAISRISLTDKLTEMRTSPVKFFDTFFATPKKKRGRPKMTAQLFINPNEKKYTIGVDIANPCTESSLSFVSRCTLAGIQEAHRINHSHLAHWRIHGI